MEIYIQELVAATFFADLPMTVRRRIVDLAVLAPKVLDKAFVLMKEDADHLRWRAEMQQVIGKNFPME